MATGTGKTFTALGAICCLREKNNGKLGVIVSVPLTYLVEQWAQDIKRFGITPIVAYSSSTTRNWPTILRLELNKHRRKGTFFCVVTTNQTFASSNFQQALIGFNSNNSNLCLVADEAHNFGAPEKIKLLSEKFGDQTSTQLLPSDVEDIFKDILDFIIDSGGHYKIKKD